MKKIFFAIITLLICFNVKMPAQCFDLYIKTPKNSDVKACRSGGYSSSMVQQADSYSRTFAIQVFESGTNSYNCHGYAWHKKEGGNNVWINNVGTEVNNLNKYWNDGSYFAYDYNIQPHLDNLKVFYKNDDHTAVTTSDPNVFISKMGCGALVSHHKNNSPYIGGSFTYYYRNNVSITGPSIICLGTTATFTVSNAPAVYTWEYSSNLTLVSQSGNTVAFSAISNGSAWMSIKLGNMEVAKYDVWIGTPQITKFVAQSTARAGGPVHFQCIGNGINSVTWQSTGTPEYMDFCDDLHSCVDITYMYSGSWIVLATVQNQCGTAQYQHNIKITGGYDENNPRCPTCPPVALYSISYPNPVSDILTIEINENIEPELESENIVTSKSAATIKKIVQTDFQLYNQFGSLVRSISSVGEKTQMNVSDLPAGIYYLHVLGLGEKPEIQTIIVSR